MTRSVEIPEAYVEQACEVMHDAYERAAIVHAWETNPASRHQDWADVPEANKATMRDAVRALLGWLGALETTPQPAGDGGLREALEKLIETHSGLEERLRRAEHHAGLLAAHPAEPAVPQPVDREALAKALRDHDGYGCGCCAFYDFDKYEDRAEAMADAVLAVLAGEQAPLRGE